MMDEMTLVEVEISEDEEGCLFTFAKEVAGDMYGTKTWIAYKVLCEEEDMIVEIMLNRTLESFDHALDTGHDPDFNR